MMSVKRKDEKLGSCQNKMTTEDFSGVNLTTCPFTQLNHVTAWIDGSSIYGASSSWCDALRSFKGGRLASGPQEDMPKKSAGQYFMWTSADPSSGQYGRQDLYGKRHLPIT